MNKLQVELVPLTTKLAQYTSALLSWRTAHPAWRNLLCFNVLQFLKTPLNQAWNFCWLDAEISFTCSHPHFSASENLYLFSHSLTTNNNYTIWNAGNNSLSFQRIWIYTHSILPVFYFLSFLLRSALPLPYTWLLSTRL